VFRGLGPDGVVALELSARPQRAILQVGNERADCVALWLAH
jgi:hypothetical protein